MQVSLTKQNKKLSQILVTHMIGIHLKFSGHIIQYMIQSLLFLFVHVYAPCGKYLAPLPPC